VRSAEEGFPGWMGFIHGTTILPSLRPAYQRDFYYDRHARYSHNLQVVCDSDRRIIMLYSGYSGEESVAMVVILYGMNKAADTLLWDLFFHLVWPVP